MQEATARPAIVRDDHLEFLDELREGGSINMAGAAPHLQRAFPSLTRQQAQEVHRYWTQSFRERHHPTL